VGGRLIYDPILGRMRRRDVPPKAGYAGKFLHSDGVDATLPDWQTPEGSGSGGDTYVRALWYHTVGAGSSGSLAAPAGGTLVLDAWPEGVDALATELDAGGKPSWETPTEADGTPVTVALDAGGAWTLSGVPAAYPIGIVFCYRTKVADLQDAYTLDEAEPEPAPQGETVLQAGAAVGGHRVVSVDAAGKVQHTDVSSRAAVRAVVGISVNAADADGKVRVRHSGRIVEPSWSWTVQGPIYCGAAGVLTQTPPTSGAVLRVGVAVAGDAMVVRVGVAFFLA